MGLQGKDGGTWKDASAVYGKNSNSWLYAKSAWANKNGVWTRAWTDCRQHDAGGRDWTASAGTTEYQGSCGNRQSRVRTDYTKTGCTSYSRYTSWVASPDCNATCFTASTSTVYSGTCLSRTSATRTTYTANAGSGCTTYYVDGPYTSSPTCGECGGSCWTQITNTPAFPGTITVGGTSYYWIYVGEIGNYTYLWASGSNSCDGANDYYEYGRIYQCGASYCFIKDGCSYQGI